MNRLFIMTVVLFSSMARADFKDERLDKKQMEMIEERMEEAPTSTSLGGARGGDLEKDQKKDIRQQHGEDKQKFLYEYDGVYRDGL